MAQTMTHTTLKLKIDGMHCDACIRRLAMALKKLPTVHIEHIAIGEADVTFDASILQTQAIIDAVDLIGFHGQVAH